MAETETHQHAEPHDEDVHDANYQAPPEKTIEEIMAADQEDESLRRYKEALLGAAQAETIIVGKYRTKKKKTNIDKSILKPLFCNLYKKIPMILEK